MLKKTRSHPFNTGAQVRERDDLITRWLDPESPDTKVIGGVAPTFRQLAAGLSAHFKIRPLSERAVWQYVREARDSSDKNLVTRRRGRPVAEKQEHEPALPKRPRGRPKKATVRTDDGLGVEPVLERVKPPRRPSAKTHHANFLAQLAAEAVQLTGLSPSALHQTFSGQAGWKPFLGERSGFFYRLQKLDAKFLAADASAIRSDDDVDHSLRLHQVVLQTLDGPWCVLLFGYEPRSFFLNAACYVAHPEVSNEGAARLSGRPVKRLHPTWRASWKVEDGQAALHLPAETLLAFASETRALMAVPVDTVWLSPSLGNQAALIAQLQALAPEGRFSAIPSLHRPFILPEAGKAIRVTALCRQLEKLLNDHYQEVAFARLDEYQGRVDRLIKADFRIQTLASGRQLYRRRKRLTILGEGEDSKARRQYAAALVEFRQSVHERLHVKRRLSIVPVHLACDVD